MTDIYPGAAGETPQDGRQTAAPIGPDEVRAAYQTLLKYKAGKANLEKRIIDNQQWYKLRQWECLRRRGGEREQIEPVSAWLFNAIANKHADAMDAFPAASILPRSLMLL